MNAQFLAGLLSPATRQSLTAWDGSSPLLASLRAALINDLSQLLQTWLPKSDLLESGPNDLSFVVEMDNDGYAHLRFGSGGLGHTPEAGTSFEAHMRVGNGPSGNVGAETILYLVFRQTVSGLNLAPRNPLPAIGGTAPEPIAEVKMFAPYAFRKVLERAITADDYAALAADNARRLAERSALMVAALNEAAAPPASVAERRMGEEEEPSGPPTLGPEICATPFRKLQGAKGSLRWTGSWYEALVAIDPLGTEQADAELLEEITAYLEPYRRIGHDLEVRLANYAPLDLGLIVCVKPAYLRGHVEAALLDVFSNRVLPDGTLGFFHPDNLTFGEGIFVSRIVAAAQAVQGVEEVQVTRLERYEIGEPLPGMEFASFQRNIPISFQQATSVFHPITTTGAPMRPPTPGASLGVPTPRVPPGGIIVNPIAIGRRTASEEVPVTGVLNLGPFEIARLDNDPSFPENGRLTLDVRGGR